jgi:hypothetical protein
VCALRVDSLAAVGLHITSNVKLFPAAGTSDTHHAAAVDELMVGRSLLTAAARSCYHTGDLCLHGCLSSSSLHSIEWKNHCAATRYINPFTWSLSYCTMHGCSCSAMCPQVHARAYKLLSQLAAFVASPTVGPAGMYALTSQLFLGCGWHALQQISGSNSIHQFPIAAARWQVEWSSCAPPNSSRVCQTYACVMTPFLFLPFPFALRYTPNSQVVRRRHTPCSWSMTHSKEGASLFLSSHASSPSWPSGLPTSSRSVRGQYRVRAQFQG